MPPTGACWLRADFLKLLPAENDGWKLLHAIAAGHESFADPAFVALLREAKDEVTQVVLDAPNHPMIAGANVGFVYLQLQRSEAGNAMGHAETNFAAWAKRRKSYETGGVPGDLTTLGPKGRRGRNGMSTRSSSRARRRAIQRPWR